MNSGHSQIRTIYESHQCVQYCNPRAKGKRKKAACVPDTGANRQTCVNARNKMIPAGYQEREPQTVSFSQVDRIGMRDQGLATACNRVESETSLYSYWRLICI